MPRLSAHVGAEWRFWGKVSIKEGCWIWKGYTNKDGYGSFGGSGGKNVFAHRFSYLNMVGEIPSGLFIDHKCHNRACVAPHHLRLATKAQNMWNQGSQVTNTSGFKGVSWHRHAKKWESRISGKFLGYFTTAEAAHAAYCAAATKLHGEFANFGGVN